MLAASRPQQPETGARGSTCARARLSNSRTKQRTSGLRLFRRPHSKLSALLFFAGLLVAISAVMVRSEPATAHFSSGEWSHDNSACDYATTRQDPVSLIFYGWGYADRAADSVKFHFGGWGDGGMGQHFASHGFCPETTHAPASGGDPQYHIRIKKTYDGDGTWDVTSASTPHFEHSCGLSHTVYPNGFAEGREYIVNNIYWREGHGWGGYQWWGNTEPRVPECGDTWAFGDGNVGFMLQHYSFHS